MPFLGCVDTMHATCHVFGDLARLNHSYSALSLVKKYSGMAHVYLIKLTKYRRIYFIDGTEKRTLDGLVQSIES